MAAVGYSGTPLWKKLGLKDGMRCTAVGAPSAYWDDWLAGAPVADWGTHEAPEFIHIFSVDADRMVAELHHALGRISRDGMIWVSWPKKASKVSTTITENVIRAAAFETDLVDVKVCAVSDVWSGLKLVIRKEKR